jgi:hypothetical protein
MLTLLLVASAVSVLGSGIAIARGRGFARRGCPRCQGDLERGGSGLRCRPCGLYWTLEGVPVGHVREDEHMPRAEARIRGRSPHEQP